MAIEFGIFDHVEANNDKPAAQIYDERIALLKHAEQGGFSAFHLAEHHGHALSVSPSPLVFMAALARETTRLKLIPSVVCLPLHHPVRVFEELLMVDGLSHGRLEVGVGKGITPFEHMFFGHIPEEAAARNLDTFTLLLRAFETGIMSSEGSKFYDFTEMKPSYGFVQSPYPPLWTAGNVDLAGTLGHKLVFPMRVTEQIRARYADKWAASRQEPGHQNPHVPGPWIAQSQTVVVADTDEEAVAILRRRWPKYLDKLNRAHGRIPPHLQTEVPPMDNPIAQMQLQRDPLETELAVAGSVDTVRKYFVDCAREGLVNSFVLMLPVADMSEEETWRTVDAFTSDIIPAVRAVESVSAEA